MNQFCKVNIDTKIENVMLIELENVTYADVSVNPIVKIDQLPAIIKMKNAIIK